MTSSSVTFRHVSKNKVEDGWPLKTKKSKVSHTRVHTQNFSWAMVDKRILFFSLWTESCYISQVSLKPTTTYLSHLGLQGFNHYPCLAKEKFLFSKD